MASTATTKSSKKNKRTRLRYFFVNGELHKKLHINRGKDLLTAWNYAKGQRVRMNYTDTLRLHETAFSMVQVAEMLNRKRLTLERAIINGDIPMPQFSYSLTGEKKKRITT